MNIVSFPAVRSFDGFIALVITSCTDRHDKIVDICVVAMQMQFSLRTDYSIAEGRVTRYSTRLPVCRRYHTINFENR